MKNKYGVSNRKEYKRLWMREYRAKIYAARTIPAKRGRKRKDEREPLFEGIPVLKTE